MNTQLDWKVRVDNVALALEIGERHHWGFKVLGNYGMLIEPVERDGFIYSLLPPDFTLKPWVYEILKSTSDVGVPFQQVLIGHEVVAPPKPKPWVVTPEKPELPEIDWKQVGKVAGGIAVVAAGVAGAIAVGMLVLVAGALCSTDPVIVIVVDDVWVVCAQYYD